MSQLAEPLPTARDAAGRHAWREAYDAYGAADRADLTPDDLEAYKAFVLDIAESVAEAKKGVAPSEEASLGKIKEALGTG